MRSSESQEYTDTALAEIAWLSAHNPNQIYHSLIHHFNEDSLRHCFDRLDGKKAVGVDRVSKAIYGENLSTNLEDLITRMKRMSYRPGPVREVLIPKEGKTGATRPLGISNFEDKLIQKRMQEIQRDIVQMAEEHQAILDELLIDAEMKTKVQDKIEKILNKWDTKKK